MNHAFNVGVMEGGSDNLSEENAGLKVELERAREKSQELVKGLKRTLERNKELKVRELRDAKLQQELTEVKKELAAMRSSNQGLLSTVDKLQSLNVSLEQQVALLKKYSQGNITIF